MIAITTTSVDPDPTLLGGHPLVEVHPKDETEAIAVLATVAHLQELTDQDLDMDLGLVDRHPKAVTARSVLAQSCAITPHLRWAMDQLEGLHHILNLVQRQHLPVRARCVRRHRP
jgi:hypothetical protein